MFYAKPSIYFSFSFTIWLIIVSITHLQLIYHFHHTYPEQKKQILLLIIAVIGFIGGVTNFLPMYTDRVYPYGNFLVPVHSIIVTYAILKHQLLDIAIVIKKSIIYSLLIALISIIYSLMIVVSEKFLQGIVGYQSLLISVSSAFLLEAISKPKNFTF